MEDYQKRLMAEDFNLTESMVRFKVFMNSERFGQCNQAYQTASKEQYNDMLKYSSHLMERIKLVIDKADFDQFIKEPEFDFGTAIRLLKEGRAIARKGWNGKGMFIIKQVPAHIDHTIIPKMQSLPQVAKDILMSRVSKDGVDRRFIDYTNQMLIVNPSGRADSWVPSSSDVFATDWYEVKVKKDE